jgi:predicted Zn-dependent protease
VFPFAKNFDPPPWWYPVRRSLAAAHLKAGRYDAAEKEASASLADWPRDALALRILAQAEARQGKSAAAKVHAAQARREWRGDLARTPIDLS